jgi:hypothetical protein
LFDHHHHQSIEPFCVALQTTNDMPFLSETLDVLLILLKHGQREADKRAAQVENLLLISSGKKKRSAIIRNEVEVIIQKQGGSVERLRILAVSAKNESREIERRLALEFFGLF